MSDEEMDTSLEGNKVDCRGGLLRQKADNKYSQEDYHRRLKEDKKKRMDYLMQNSELGALLKGDFSTEKKVPDTPEKRRREGKKAGEIDEAELEEIERRPGSEFFVKNHFWIPGSSKSKNILNFRI